jgi:hypothetical protein
MNWLWFHLGLANGNYAWYLFPSGWGGNLAIVLSVMTAPYLLWRKHNCVVRWCWRIGRHEFPDPSTGITHILCRRHDPRHPGRRPVTAAHIRRVHLEAAGG